MIFIRTERCDGCGACVEVCPNGAIYMVDGKANVDETLCSDCEACIAACPTEAITIVTTERELVAEPVRRPARRPEPEVVQFKTEPAPVPLRATVLPVVGATLAWAGREIIPRLADLLLDSLDRREVRQHTTGTDRGTVRGGKGIGRRRRFRQRGGERSSRR